jgi:hypothetical protein
MDTYLVSFLERYLVSSALFISSLYTQIRLEFVMHLTLLASLPGISIVLMLLFAPVMPLHAGGASPSSVLRVNVGGLDYVDHNGNRWSSDAGYNTGNVALAYVPIYGTDDPILHQTMRWDSAQGPELAYRFLMPNGNYSVNLYMSETAANDVAVRSFDVYIEYDLVHEAVDIYKESGGYGYSLVKTALVTIVDGELNINFVHQGGDPVINAIEVIPVPGITTNPDQPLVLTAQDTGRNHTLIGWESHIDSSSSSIAGYSIQRNDVEIATSNLASYLDTELAADTSYSYSVTAYDVAWNIIATSNALNITTLTSDETNSTPLITGNPVDVIYANTRFIFQPITTDVDGDPLSYRITNKPCWASFDTVTGRLSGEPGANDIGTYNDIVITVTDGMNTVSLPAFSVNVLEGTTAAELENHKFTLNWTAPTKRTDGSVLTQAEIGGYRIYYGNTTGYYPYMVEVADATAETATITHAAAGTMYVVMTTYDIDGRESGFSSAITKIFKASESLAIKGL